MISPPALTQTLRAVHDQMVLQAPTPLQIGVESLVTLDETYYKKLAAKYQERRDFLVGELRVLGFQIDCVPHAAYYIFAKFRSVPKLAKFETAYEASMFLVETVKVATVPGDNFYNGGWEKNYIRFCFCRQMKDLREAAARLREALGEA